MITFLQETPGDGAKKMIVNPFFSQNLTLGYMTKTLNQIFFFPPPKSEYFFQQH
jgi:hypothetical protein